MQLIQILRARIADFAERVPVKKVDMGISISIMLLGIVVYVAIYMWHVNLAAFSFVDNVELRTLDARFQMRGPRPVDDRIVIVGIDEKTLQKVGAWPIPRNAYASLIDQVSAGGAKVISFDVTFPTPEKNSAVEALKRLEQGIGSGVSPAVLDRIREIQRTSDNDAILAETMQRAGNVVLGHIFLGADTVHLQDELAIEAYYKILWGKPFPQMRSSDGSNPIEAWKKNGGNVAYGIEPNIELLAYSAHRYGFFNQVPDRDGTMRRHILLYFYEGREFFGSLAFETLRLYEDVNDQSILAEIGEGGLAEVEIGPRKLMTERDGTLHINFAGPYKTYPQYSMTDVIDGTVPSSTFKDKIVFVGATAVGIGDLRSTPYPGTYMGVETHANSLDNMLHNDERGRGFLTRGGKEEIVDLLFMVLFGLGLGYIFGRVRPFYATLSALVALGIFSAVVYFCFTSLGMWLNFVMPAGVLLTNYGAVTSFRMIFEEREKRRLRKSFGQYVSPGVIALLEKDPKKYFRPGGESKELSVMFSDIRSFTTIAEGLTPDELVHLLNEYLGEMTDILFKRWGTLDKYIGDAVMAFWGSPYPQADHAVRACACALDMSARLDELNMKWEAEGKKALDIGIGINTGEVNVGNMGSAKRLAWTVMGDNVNLASRLEGQTKEYHIRCLVSETTYVEAKDHYVFRDLDKIRVKGKLKPVAVYELMAFAKDAAHYQELLTKWNDALADYRAMRFEEAIVKFEAILSRWPDDGPSHTFLKRSHEYKVERPEPDWDGVYVAKTK